MQFNLFVINIFESVWTKYGVIYCNNCHNWYYNESVTDCASIVFLKHSSNILLPFTTEVGLPKVADMFDKESNF